MMIKVKNVDVETVGEGKKSYQVAEVFYDTDKYKNQAHKVFSFVNPAVFATISKASKGDTFEVDVGKNAKGYNQWNGISASDGSASNDTPSAAPTRSAAGGTMQTRTYETAEEREARQRLIVRQSSLTAALGTLAPGAKGPLDKEAVKALAEEYSDWVFEKVDLFDQPNDIDSE